MRRRFGRLAWGGNALRRGEVEIREAYEAEAVAESYVRERFEQPLGALLHARQSAVLRRALRREKPARVLEVAPGPARLTVEATDVLPGRGVVMDSSAAMLQIAARRLSRAASRWDFTQGDAFALPFRAAAFDLVYSFRLIRHFERADRCRLLREIARVLRPDGVVLFDAVNAVVSEPLRAARPEGYEHYDALLRQGEVTEELAECGFTRSRFVPVQRRYGLQYRLQVLVAPRSRWLARAAMEVVDRIGGGEPLEWVVECRRG